MRVLVARGDDAGVDRSGAARGQVWSGAQRIHGPLATVIVLLLVLVVVLDLRLLPARGSRTKTRTRRQDYNSAVAMAMGKAGSKGISVRYGLVSYWSPQFYG